jgi:hypothetical protein
MQAQQQYKSRSRQNLGRHSDSCLICKSEQMNFHTSSYLLLSGFLQRSGFLQCELHLSTCGILRSSTYDSEPAHRIMRKAVYCASFDKAKGLTCTRALWSRYDSFAILLHVADSSESTCRAQLRSQSLNTCLPCRYWSKSCHNPSTGLIAGYTCRESLCTYSNKAKVPVSLVCGCNFLAARPNRTRRFIISSHTYTDFAALYRSIDVRADG